MGDVISQPHPHVTSLCHTAIIEVIVSLLAQFFITILFLPRTA